MATTFKNLSISQCIGTIDSFFNKFLKYSKFTHKMVYGKSILEIGPGENVGRALKFLGMGAKKVTCIDKFYAVRNKTKEYEIYKGLRGELDKESKKNFDRAINLENGIYTFNQDKLECFSSIGIEDAENKFNHKSFDIIFSHAVSEHINNVNIAFDVMDSLLAPGGYMTHYIDFKDHGLFAGQHPLTFLTLTEPAYRRHIAKNSCKLNRKMVNYYKEKIADLGYNAKIFVSQVVYESDDILKTNLNTEREVNSGLLLLRDWKENIKLDVDYNINMISHIEKIRPILINEFKTLSIQNLLTAAILIIARKNKEANEKNTIC